MVKEKEKEEGKAGERDKEIKGRRAKRRKKRRKREEGGRKEMYKEERKVGRKSWSHTALLGARSQSGHPGCLEGSPAGWPWK